jgi:hypothetical protein
MVFRILLTLAVLSTTLAAQSDRGIITGVVADTTGGVVIDAKVIATHVATNVPYHASTTGSGDFTIPSLPVGDYSLTVEKDGFKQFLRKGITVTGGSVVRIDAKLEVGATQQTVVVSADVQQLETESARVANAVTNKMVDELPLVVGGDMRSPFNLATITPQVNGSGQNFRIGGGQGGSWGIQLDGVSANTNRFGDTAWASLNSPSLEAITEFNVETNGFKAEFGRGGGGQLTFVSRSGTNQFHGSAYDFMRNDALDARGFFAKDRGIYKQHDFGGSGGGPVWIPKIYNGRGRTFFFATYEGFRNRVGASRVPTGIPPAEFYEGDFRNYVRRDLSQVAIYDPATTQKANNIWTRTPFPNNMIPKARFDPLAAAIAPYGAEAKTNRPELQPGSWEYVWENYYASGVALRPVDKASAKIDHMLSSAHRFSFFFNYSKRSQVPGPDGPPGIPGVVNTFDYNYQKSYVYRWSWDWTVSPRILNRFYVGVNNWDEIHYPISGSMSWKDKICFKNSPNCDEALHRVNHEFGIWGGYSANGSFNPIRSFNDDLTFTKGKHTFKGGYMYERAFYNGFGRQAVMGETWFNRLNTSIPLEPNANIGGGSAFASFLLGEVKEASVETPRYVNMVYRYHAMYFQDDWRLNRRLTLNLGLRYEFTLPPINNNDELSEFDPTRPNPGAGGLPGALVFAGFGPGRENTRSLIPGWYGAIGPRLGFSFALNSKTVLRGSVSRSFAPVRNSTSSTHFQGFIQMVRYRDGTNGLEPLMRFKDGMLPYPLPPFIDPSFANESTPYYWQGNEAVRAPENLGYSFNLQRQISPNMMLEVGYSAMMGTHLVASLLNINQVDTSRLPPELSIFTQSGRNLLLSRNFNDPTLVALGIKKPYPSFSDTVGRSLKPFPQYLDIDTERGGGDHSGHSTYHSMLVKLTRNFSQGLMINASYVLSKWFTDAEQWATGDALDHYNRRVEKSLAGNDRTHEVKLNYVYELPFGRGKRWLNQGLAAATIGGWRIGAVHFYGGGTPLGLGGAYSFPLVGNRPYVTTYENWKNQNIQGHDGTRFDPYVDSYFQPRSFFPDQPRDRFGNMTRRNPKVRNEPSWNENISLAKTFSITESFRLDARLEAFNVLNRVRWSNPNSDLNSVSFGLVRGQANGARNMQLGLKLYW